MFIHFVPGIQLCPFAIKFVPGIEVNFIEYPGVLHGFFGLTGMIDEADAANIAAGRALVAAFSK